MSLTLLALPLSLPVTRCGVAVRSKLKASASMSDGDLQLAMRAVRLASRLCSTVQRKLLSSETQSKSDKSPVTVADYGAQALVSWALARASKEPLSMVAEEDSAELRGEGGHVMLGRITELVNEAIAEGGDDEAGAGDEVEPLSPLDVLEAIDRGASAGGGVGRHWVLDPIDGTRGFLRGDQYAIALGLLEDGQVVAGVLGCPNLPLASIVGGVDAAVATGEGVGCLFAARRGFGTTVEALDGSSVPKKVHVSTVVDPADATFCESYEAEHSMQSLTGAIAKTLGMVNPPVRIDSQAKYGAMSRGDAAIYLRFPRVGYREKIWDHAAGTIVMEEAGGIICDAAGKALDFSKGRYLDLTRGILATNAALMPRLLAAVQTAIAEEEKETATKS